MKSRPKTIPDRATIIVHMPSKERAEVERTAAAAHRSISSQARELIRLGLNHPRGTNKAGG